MVTWHCGHAAVVKTLRVPHRVPLERVLEDTISTHNDGMATTPRHKAGPSLCLQVLLVTTCQLTCGFACCSSCLPLLVQALHSTEHLQDFPPSLVAQIECPRFVAQVDCPAVKQLLGGHLIRPQTLRRHWQQALSKSAVFAMCKASVACTAQPTSR